MVIILCFALSISSNSHSPIIFSSPKRSKIPSQNPNPNLVKSLLHSPTFSKIANWVSMEATSINGLDKWRSDFSRAFMYYLDRSAIHIVGRWIGTLAIVTIYVLRVYLVQGFYIVSYGLGIYVLNLLIGFLSPMVDPEIEALDGASLPTRGTDEFKPFIRRLPEFKLWYSITKAFCVAFVMTFFSIFDIPVFWPILLFYWTVLFVLTMKRQILHMIKYKYIPISVGKQTCKQTVNVAVLALDEHGLFGVISVMLLHLLTKFLQIDISDATASLDNFYRYTASIRWKHFFLV